MSVVSRLQKDRHQGAVGRLPAYRRLCAGALCLAWLLGVWAPATSWGAPVDENQLKAALLYKLVKFVSWPDSLERGRSDHLNICVLGDGGMAKQLLALQGRKAKGRIIRVVELKDERVTADRCPVLFVSKGAEKRVWQEAEKGVLTASDRTGFSAEGGILELRRLGNRMRFAINRGKAKKAGLSFPAQVLALAIIVNDSEGGE